MDQMSYQDWRGQTAYDANGDKIGTIDNVYMDEQTGRPEWLAISTGLLGTRTNFVPIAGSTMMDSGDGLRLPYTKDQVKDAPNVDPTGSLTDDEERQLFSHYGYSYDSPNYGDRDRIDSSYSFDRDSDIVAEATTTNQQVTEQANKVRLRKYRWTEQVPVTHEEVRVEETGKTNKR